MTFKIIKNKDEEIEEITKIQMEQMGSNQVNINLITKDGKETVIAIYEEGMVYVAGKQVKSWK